MTRLLSVLIAAVFAAVTVNALAATHAGAPKADDKKMEKMDKSSKTEKKGEKKAKAKKTKAEKKDEAPKK